MDPLPRSSRPRPLIRSLALASVIALLGSATGASLTTAAGDSYAACLSVYDELYNVAIGNSPAGSCANGKAVIRWNQRGAKGAKGAKGQRGPRGRKGNDGATGPRGETGPRGAPGADLKLRTYTATAETSGSAGQLMQALADCDPGDLATGGGFETDGLILASLGVGTPSPAGWQAVAQANDEATTLSSYVICADLPPTRS